MLGRLHTGQKVLATDRSHLHGNVGDYLSAALPQLEGKSGEGHDLIKQTVDFGEHIGYTTCVPSGSEPVFFALRPGRNGLSKFSLNATCRSTRELTLVLRRLPRQGYYTLLTAYFGAEAAVEPFSPIIAKNPSQRQVSLNFWGRHALVPKLGKLSEGEPFDSDTITTVVPHGWQPLYA